MSVNVLIQPAYGNRTAQRNWKTTLDKELVFDRSPYIDHLSTEQQRQLAAAHPNHRARFWGATYNHNDTMDQLRRGDIVLFSGLKQVRAVGEIGLSFRNPEFADELWKPHPEKGSWLNVFSLATFQCTDIPYEEFWALPSFTSRFRELRLLSGAVSEDVLRGLSIEPSVTRLREEQEELSVAAALAKGEIVDAEALRTLSTSYERPEGTIIVHRAEAILVDDYRVSQNLPAHRIRTPNGLTDLHVIMPEGHEIIEAKNSPRHEKVRQAVAQLLDYAPYSPGPLARLTALFPARPQDADIKYMHRVGIDCLFMHAKGGYTRIPAPGHRRELMRTIWTENA
jgi:hypothetical protein